jgi:hypothetical protein
MRRGQHDYGWLVNEAGQFAGVALGYDFVAEHEDSTRRIFRAFGMELPEFPVGVEARRITRTSTSLRFAEYMWKGRDRRRKGRPAALLMFTSSYAWETRSLEDLIRYNELGFYGDGDSSEAQDIACSWMDDEFGIHVRGAENVERLRALSQAFETLDVCVGLPGGGGFVGRKGLSFVLLSQVDEKTAHNIRERDLAARRLEDAVVATGIREKLKSAGRGYFALAPTWENPEKEEGVKFFLNPHDQKRCNSGWFTVPELEQWAAGAGPVVKDAGLEAFHEANRNWSYDLLVRLKNASVVVGQTRLAWADEAKSRIGVFIRPPWTGGNSLAEGVYPYDELLERYPLPA